MNEATRLRCLELAAQLSSSPSATLELARKFEAYIIGLQRESDTTASKPRLQTA